MKFCFVMPYHIAQNRGGGAEVQAWYLAQALSARGFDIYYICQSVIPQKVNQVEKMNGVTIFWLKTAGRFEWMDRKKYYRSLEKIKPDFVIQRMSSSVTDTIGKYCEKKNRHFIWICCGDAIPRKWHFVKKQLEIYRQK
ncbi:MAG: glycosyltransferase family 4 protein, partial [Spirochaetales bacterium]|nr:glycosyltransferase family 4 protein [Spirochaetales bacterium]